jgi:hypothetical protein
MSKQQQVEIVRGTVVIGTGAPRQLGDTRSFSNQHLARPGEVVTLPADEAARLARSGAVKVAQMG